RHVPATDLAATARRDRLGWSGRHWRRLWRDRRRRDRLLWARGQARVDVRLGLRIGRGVDERLVEGTRFVAAAGLAVRLRQHEAVLEVVGLELDGLLEWLDGRGEVAGLI